VASALTQLSCSCSSSFLAELLPRIRGEYSLQDEHDDDCESEHESTARIRGPVGREVRHRTGSALSSLRVARDTDRMSLDFVQTDADSARVGVCLTWDIGSHPTVLCRRVQSVERRVRARALG
jgi:hypothetical protein